MKIRLWGCRGSIPVPDTRMMKYGGNTACVEVTAGGRTLVFDAGTGIRLLGEDLRARGVREIGLFITHSHWDHIQGFPFFMPAYDPETRITVYGCTNSYRQLKDILSRQMSHEYFPVSFPELTSEIRFAGMADRRLETGGAAVHCLPVNHPVATIALKVVENGKSFVFMTDNELRSETPQTPYAELVRFCEGADLLVHDAQFSDAEYPRRRGWGHSTFEQAAVFARDAGAKRLLFFHHDPNRRDGELDAVEAGFAAASGLTAHCAREGSEYLL